MSDNKTRRLSTAMFSDLANVTVSQSVQAIGVFVHQQMILKVLPVDPKFEKMFKKSYMDFKSECLIFLNELNENEMEQQQNQEEQDYDKQFQLDTQSYTMYYHRIGDKDGVFLIQDALQLNNSLKSRSPKKKKNKKNKNKNKLSVLQTINLSIYHIIDNLLKANDNLKAKPKKHKMMKSAPVGDLLSDNNSEQRHGFSSMEQLFRSFDTSGTQFLDVQEFENALSTLNMDWSDDDINFFFDSIDQQQQGEISLDDFMRFMTFKPTKNKNVKSLWKELQRAIHVSIILPTVKNVKDSNITPETYQKNLSNLEKLVNMLEESMVERELAHDQQLIWRNKILSHREFIRRHQDVVGRAISQENTRLKKENTRLKKEYDEKERKLSEVQLSIEVDLPNASDDDIPDFADESEGEQKEGKKRRKSNLKLGDKANRSKSITRVSKQKKSNIRSKTPGPQHRSFSIAGGSRSNSPRKRKISVAQSEMQNDALITRLRRENTEMKRKIQIQTNELKKLHKEKLKNSMPPMSPGLKKMRRSSVYNMEVDELEELVQKLKKTNYELRTERKDLRKQLNEMTIQFNTAKDRNKLLSESDGMEEDLLKQLARARQDAKSQRKAQQKVRANMLALGDISARLKRKLLVLVKRIQQYDPEMAQRILKKKTANEMMEELAANLIEMLSKLENEQKRVEKFKKEKRKLLVDHENTILDLNADYSNMKIKIAEQENALRDKTEENELLKEQLAGLKEAEQESERLRQQLVETEKNRRQEMSADLKNFYETKIRDLNLREKNFKKQIQILRLMPGNANMARKIDRLYKMFDKMDVDKDGFINFTEFSEYAAELGFGDNVDEQQDCFYKIDTNEDNLISFEEFKQACLKNLERVQDINEDDWSMTYQLLNKPPQKWNQEDVHLWMNKIGFKQHAANAQNVDGNMLLNMKKASQVKHGFQFQKNAHVRKMMKEIKHLKRRNDLISNLQYDNERLKSELKKLKEHGPTWSAVNLLQRRVRDLEGKMRKEKYARENIMLAVKDELRHDDRFDADQRYSPEYEDVLAEVALLKGALTNANQKLRKQPAVGKLFGQESEYDNNVSPEEQNKNFGQPVGRFLQKWYVLANHSTQYWISRSNAELNQRDEHFRDIVNERERARKAKQQPSSDGRIRLQSASMDTIVEENKDDEQKPLIDSNDPELTEALDWIIFDSRQQRIVSELRMRNRGEKNDPKEMKLQVGASPSGPWSDVIECQLDSHSKRQRIGGFQAEARFWRVVFLQNYGEEALDAPRYVLYECQFWGPLDQDVENNHFVIE